jgi:hypothetical protein
MMQISAFSAPRPNLSLSLSLFIRFFFLFIPPTHDSFFYLYHHLYVVAAEARNATIAYWILLSVGWRLKLGRI